MIEDSITTMGYGINGSVWEIMTFGFSIDTPASNFILSFSLYIDQHMVVELIR